MQWAAALHGHLKVPDLKKDGHLCGTHSSRDHWPSNAPWPPEGMTKGKGMRNCLLKAAGNTGDTGQVPLSLASQPLAAFLRSKGRCHPPQINNMVLLLSFWHPFITCSIYAGTNIFSTEIFNYSSTYKTGATKASGRLLAGEEGLLEAVSSWMS